MKHTKFKTFGLNAKIRLVVNDVTLSLTVKQALEQFLDGGEVESFLRLFDAERAKYPKREEAVTGLGTVHRNKNMQIDLY